MKNKGIQKSENEKLLEFGIRLSNLISDIEELKDNRAKLENLNMCGSKYHLSIRTKDCNIMTYVKYLHELQNAYNLLTNEELEVKL